MSIIKIMALITYGEDFAVQKVNPQPFEFPSF
jgi:hypothetical protein